MFRFRIVQGIHLDGKKTYYAGQKGKDIIETDIDLVARFNHGPSSIKFVRLHSDDLEVATVEPSLETMTVTQLKELAAESEIDLGGAVLKADIIDTIRSCLGVQSETVGLPA